MVRTKNIKKHPNTKFLSIFNGQSEEKKLKRTRIQSSSPFSMVRTKNIKKHPNTKIPSIFNGQSEQKKIKRTGIQTSSPFSMVSQNKKN